MKRQTHGHQIFVSLTTGFQMEMRDLEFLRQMAQHCSATQMAGSSACDRLDKLLADLGVVSDCAGPVYDIFK